MRICLYGSTRSNDDNTETRDALAHVFSIITFREDRHLHLALGRLPFCRFLSVPSLAIYCVIDVSLRTRGIEGVPVIRGERPSIADSFRKVGAEGMV